MQLLYHLESILYEKQVAYSYKRVTYYNNNFYKCLNSFVHKQT